MTENSTPTATAASVSDAGFCLLNARQQKVLDGVVARARNGMALFLACRKSGIRCNTALRGLGFPNPCGTVTTQEMDAALARWPQTTTRA